MYNYDVEYWQDQLRGARDWQESHGNYKDWNRALLLWRQEAWNTEEKSDDLPFNIGRVIGLRHLPSLYYRNPYVLASTQNSELQEFTPVVEAIMNPLLYGMDVKAEFGAMIIDCFVFGNAIGKLGYIESFRTPENVMEGLQTMMLESREIASTQSFDFKLRDMAPYFMRIDPMDFLLPFGVTDIEKTPWAAVRICRRYEDIKDDPRYKISTKDSLRLKAARTREGTFDKEWLNDKSKNFEHDYVEFWEITDIKNKEVLAVSMGFDKFVQEPHGEPILDVCNPFVHFDFAPDPQRFWKLSDLLFIEPQVLEATETRTQIKIHRQMSLLRLIIDRGLFAGHEEEQDKLEQGDPGAVILSEGSPVNRIMELIPHFPDQLLMWDERVRGDIEELTGYDRPGMGVSPNKTHITAEATSDARVNREERISWKREQVALAYERMCKKLMRIVFSRWTGQQISSVVGKDFMSHTVNVDNVKRLVNEFTLRVDAESMEPKSKMERIQQIQALMQMTQGFPVNYHYFLTLLLRNFEWINLSQALPKYEEMQQSMQQFQQQQQGVTPEQQQSGQQRASKLVGGAVGASV